MTRHSRIWLAVAVLFTLVNLGGAVWAVARGELFHTGIHAGLLVVGAYAVGRLAARRIASY